MSRIAVLIGSQRKGGNTEILANAFIDGASKNHEIEVISVADVKVKGCTGCNFCRTDENHRCAQKDDMQSIYEKLIPAEIIVIATPVYFYGVSAQLKCIIDRLHNPIRNKFKVKKLVLLSVAADKIPTVFDSVKTMYNSILKYFSLEDGGVVTVFGVEEKGAINNNPELQKAYKLGESLKL
ncbi:MAG TPA: flavodoxin family protein [Oscillospiraceae bacterium]|nr:flavodoxin family protein [Oscillospiraceae bacterium]